VANDTMTVDLSDSSPQVSGNVNCGESAAIAAVRVAFKSFTSPDTPADEGSFRPLHVVLPPGRFLSAVSPAAVGQWSASVPLLIDTLLLALSGADSDRVPAAHHGSLGPYIWTGTTNGGREFVHVDTCVGGWGASPGRDGGVGLKTYMHGDTHTVPSEIEEAMFPLRVEFNRLEPDSGGAGEFRGGLSSAKCYRALRDVNLTFAFEREKCRPWGREGGLEGMHNRLLPFDKDGNPSGPPVTNGTLMPVSENTMVVLISGSGGGCGRPEDRADDAVAADLRDGYVTPEVARSVYRHDASVPAAV
jgi:N-methylhydantoinase B